MTIKKQDAVLLVFSGGQDSTTLLAYALNRFEHVECISFFYGQNHSIELEQAKKITSKVNVTHTIIDIGFLNQITDSALNSGGDVNQAHSRMKNLPASWVPNRNMIFLTLATTYAQKVGIKNIMTGACQTDSSGYPDCRHAFITSLQDTLNYSTYGFKIHPQDIHNIFIKAEIFEVSESELIITLPIAIERELKVLNEFFNFKTDLFTSYAKDSNGNLKRAIKGSDDCSLILNFLKHRDMTEAEKKYFSQFYKYIIHDKVSNNPDYENQVTIITPLMYLDKAETFKLAADEGGLETVINDSLTCYKGDLTMNAWGMGCDDCPACKLRKKGYEEYLKRFKEI